ncbi:MAG: glycogen/starch synthase, partial [Bacilli bacterium]
MNILMCASESNPFYKTGGLGDVIYSLSKEFAKLGHNVSIAVPYYTHIGKIDKIDAKPYCNVNVHMNWRNINCEIYMQSVDGINYFFIKNDYYFGRNYYYGSYDDGERFAFFSLACLELIAKFPFFVDIVHVHDWQPGMIPCLLKTTYKDKPQYKNIKSVITIHNPE